jgi:hypothetical protein
MKVPGGQAAEEQEQGEEAVKACLFVTSFYTRALHGVQPEQFIYIIQL